MKEIRDDRRDKVDDDRKDKIKDDRQECLSYQIYYNLIIGKPKHGSV